MPRGTVPGRTQRVAPGVMGWLYTWHVHYIDMYLYIYIYIYIYIYVYIYIYIYMHIYIYIHIMFLSIYLSIYPSIDTFYVYVHIYIFVYPGDIPCFRPSDCPGTSCRLWRHLRHRGHQGHRHLSGISPRFLGIVPWFPK